MDGKFFKWVHFVGIFAFITLWIVATLTGWIESVTFVSHVSMVALVYAAWSAWQASRTEEKEDENINGA